MQAGYARVGMLSLLFTLLSSITRMALFSHLNADYIQVAGAVVPPASFTLPPFLLFIYFFFLSVCWAINYLLLGATGLCEPAIYTLNCDV